MDETTEALGETTGGEALCCWVVGGGSCCLGLPNEDVPAWTMRPLLRLGDGRFTENFDKIITSFVSRNYMWKFFGDVEIIEEVIKLGPPSPLMENDLFKIK